ncbi:hypothetical protein Poli38472_006431 [Pythium oligandrum]|uniref:Uncharacterized protein n=1 Tax=Pythium oligandrum TaxID=41045 RepID=A0A8K1C4K9_PYTOL|nr:hypothetical protein Poli38472_006431 [Pythium oligandrum]|eukprot:TMW56421.1 hypothetical protein Poli38472_006431 [Pythium oligandrum]
METTEEARDLEEIEEHDGDEQEAIDLADEEEADETEEDAVQGYRETVDGITNQPSVSLELRERAIVLSEKWREVDPPLVTAAPVRTHRDLPSNSQRTIEERPSLPTISAFKRQKHGKRKAPPTKEKPKDDRWTSVAVEYVKAKLYPLYKQSNGKISKDRFKTIVKQVVERFRRDATSMQSHILEPGDSRQLTNAAKTRLKKLLDQEYRSTGSTLQVGHQAVASSYSALPPGVKRPRIS